MQMIDLQPVLTGWLAVLVVGVPLVALAVGWLLAGREPRAIARQPLD
jgi:ABC-type Fe3+ transport system permease subunit